MTLPFPGARQTTGGGLRPTISGGYRSTLATTGQVVHRQGPVGLGTTDFYYRFFITFRKTEPVVYEYRGGKNFSPTLAYPQKTKGKGGRNFYRVGDLIFTRNVSKNKLSDAYPTLAKKDGSKTFLENLIDSEILGPASSNVVALRIVSINPRFGSPGYGHVETKPVIFFGKTAVYLENERRSSFDVKSLTDELAYIKLATSLNSILPLIYLTMDVLQMVGTGALKSAVSRGMAVYVARKGALNLVAGEARKQAGKLLVAAMTSNAAKATGVATLEFIKVFLKNAADSKAEEQLRAQAATKQRVDYGVLQNAIKDASIAFSIKFVDECMGSWIASVARQTGVEKSAKEYIAKKIASLITTEPANVFIGAYRKYVLDKERQRQGANSVTQNYMLKELEGWFLAYLKGFLKDSVGITTS